MTQPLYRFPKKMSAGPVPDGAVFAFVQTTDPEILLLFEAPETASGEQHLVMWLEARLRQLSMSRANL